MKAVRKSSCTVIRVLACQRMMLCNRQTSLVMVAVLSLVPFLGFGASQNTATDECAQTAHLQIYSNAVFVEEAGDVVGYELAFQEHNRKSARALLYVYEGVPNEDGISVSGQISGTKLTMAGDWVLHSIEQPSKKEMVETRPVEISGTLDSNRFRGTIKISGHATSVKLKRVGHIWMCRR
jgi:hypothetical protein